jgi:hypothetical protein
MESSNGQWLTISKHGFHIAQSSLSEISIAETKPWEISDRTNPLHDIDHFDSPTRPACDGYFEIVFYNDLEHRPQFFFDDGIPSHHRGIVS